MKAFKTPTLKAARLALANVAPAAMGAREARDRLIAAIRLAYTAKTHDAVRTECMAGFVAAAIPSNGTPAVRIANAKTILLKAGAGGTGKLKKGQSRRTDEEERAYSSARTLFARALKDAGLKTAETRGGSTATAKRKARMSKANAKPQAANSNRPASPKCKDKGSLIQYANIQAAALLATVNKNAKICPPQLSSAVQDFAKAVKALEA